MLCQYEEPESSPGIGDGGGQWCGNQAVDGSDFCLAHRFCFHCGEPERGHAHIGGWCPEGNWFSKINKFRAEEDQ